MRSRFGSEVSTQVLKRYIRGGSPLVAKKWIRYRQGIVISENVKSEEFYREKEQADFCLYWAKFVIGELVINGEHSSFSPGVYRH